MAETLGSVHDSPARRSAPRGTLNALEKLQIIPIPVSSDQVKGFAICLQKLRRCTATFMVGTHALWTEGHLANR